MLQREGRSGSMPHPFLRTWVTQEGLPLVLNLATGQIQTGTSAHGSRSSSLRVSQRNSGCSSHSLDGTHGFHSAANKIHDNTSQAACGSGGGIVVPDVRGGFFCDEPVRLFSAVVFVCGRVGWVRNCNRPITQCHVIFCMKQSLRQALGV